MSRKAITPAVQDQVFNRTIELLRDVNKPNEKDYIKAQKQAVAEAGYSYAAYVRVMKAQFEANPDNWELDPSELDDFEECQQLIQDYPEPISLAVYKNDRDARAGFLSMLFVVTEHNVKVDGKPFWWSTLVLVDGGDPYFNAPGQEIQMLTEEFNTRFQFI